jgi:hypothetical protein
MANYKTINRLTLADIERFSKKYTMVQDGCWLWGASTSSGGYGNFSLNGSNFTAHRISYFINTGVDQQTPIDHLCRVKNCINPKHLEYVTQSENVMRGELPKLLKDKYAKKTECYKGHTYNAKNTRYKMEKSKNGKMYYHRHCRLCEYARKKA